MISCCSKCDVEFRG